MLLLLVLLLFASTVLGDVIIIDPQKHQNYSNNDVVMVSWNETGIVPLLSDFSNYTFVLCTGSNDKIVAVKTLEEEVKVKQKDIWSFELRVAVNSTNIYYIQVFASGERYFSIHYTERFIVGANGTLADHSDEDPPAAVTVDRKVKPSTTINSKYFTVPYELQYTLGSVRYAPMLPTVGSIAPTKRWSGASSAKLTSRYKKGKTTPIVAYTVTQPDSRSVETWPNTGKTQAGPSGWHDALITAKPTRRTNKSL